MPGEGHRPGRWALQRPLQTASMQGSSLTAFSWGMWPQIPYLIQRAEHIYLLNSTGTLCITTHNMVVSEYEYADLTTKSR